MKKEDAKKWIDILYHIFMGDTMNGGVWEFEDKLPKYFVSDELTIGMKRGLTKDNGRVTMKSRIEIRNKIMRNKRGLGCVDVKIVSSVKVEYQVYCTI
jgi:hypothetical protein